MSKSARKAVAAMTSNNNPTPEQLAFVQLVPATSTAGGTLMGALQQQQQGSWGRQAMQAVPGVQQQVAALGGQIQGTRILNRDEQWRKKYEW